MFKKQDSDEISEHVLIIAQNDNMKENIEIIKNGNLKVMTARLEDASFYINLDKEAYYQKEKKNWDKALEKLGFVESIQYDIQLDDYSGSTFEILE